MDPREDEEALCKPKQLDRVMDQVVLVVGWFVL